MDEIQRAKVDEYQQNLKIKSKETLERIRK